MPSPYAALYPTAPLASGHLPVHLGLKILGVVKAGRVWAAGIRVL